MRVLALLLECRVWWIDAGFSVMMGCSFMFLNCFIAVLDSKLVEFWVGSLCAGRLMNFCISAGGLMGFWILAGGLLGGVDLLQFVGLMGMFLEVSLAYIL